MKLVTVDFESFYSKDFGFRTHTNESYVRDPQFEEIGFAYKLDEEEPVWVSGDYDYLKSVLLTLDIPNSAVLAHNAKFDVSILEWRFGLRPKFILDTLSMARPKHGHNAGGSLKALAKAYGIGQKGDEVDKAKGKRRADFTAHELAEYGEYCRNDVALTYLLFQILKPGFPKSEFKLIDLTIRMFTEPRLELDKAVLEAHLASVKRRKADLLASVAQLCGDSTLPPLKVLGSSAMLANVLAALDVEAPRKLNKKGKETYAFAKTDKAFTELLHHPDERVQTVVAARLGTKSTIEESRTEAFLGIASRGTLPVPLAYAGAVVTWRWAGTDQINMQNLTRGGALRKAIVAPKGHVVVVCDSSNIELRVNHTLAGQLDSVQAFRDGRDLYCEFASIIFGREITDTPENFDARQLGKIAHLSLGYGCGAPKFQEICRQWKVYIALAEAERIVKLWRDTYWKVPAMWKEAGRALGDIYHGVERGLDSFGLVRTCKEGWKTKPNHIIRYPGLRRKDGEWVYDGRRETVKIYDGKCDENLCQHLSRNIIAEQWLEVANRYPVVQQAHDELVTVVPEAEADACKRYMVQVMSTSPSWWPEIPLAAKAAFNRSYGLCK